MLLVAPGSPAWLLSRSHLLLNDGANLLRPFFQRRLVPAFDEQTGFRFRARISKENSSALSLKLGFRLTQKARQIIEFLKCPLLAHNHVTHQLRETRPALGEFGKRSFQGTHNSQDLQRANQTVTCRAEISKNHVAALLATKVEPVTQHLIDNI